MLPSKRMRRSKADVDAARFERAGKEFGGAGVKKFECGIAGRRHATCSFSHAASALLHGFEPTGKEVIGAGDEHQGFGLGGGVNHLLQFVFGCKLIAIAAEKELGQSAIGEDG